VTTTGPLAVGYKTADLGRRALARGCRGLDDSARSRLLRSWGIVMGERGRLNEAIAALDEAATGFGSQGETAAEAVAIVIRARYEAWRSLPDFQTHIASAIAKIDEIPPCPETVEVLTAVAGINYVNSAWVDVIDQAERAIAVARDLGLAEPATAFGFLGGVRCERGEAKGLDDLAAGVVEVIRSDAFYRWLALDPRDGVDARSPLDVPASNAVPDVYLLIIHRSNGRPAAVEVFDVFGPAPREGPKRAIILIRRMEGAFELSIACAIVIAPADVARAGKDGAGDVGIAWTSLEGADREGLQRPAHRFI
jgi:hypothetical protein